MISKSLPKSRSLITAGILLLVFAGNSCQKQKVEPQPNLWIPAPMRSMFDFKPGSYWILTLPGTNFVDSVYVISRKLDTLVVLHPGSHDTLNFRERLTVQYRTVFYGYQYRIEVEGGPYCFENTDALPCYYATKVVLNSNNTVQAQARIYYYPEFVAHSWPIQSGSLGGPYMRLESIGAFQTSDSTEWTNVRRMIIEEDPLEQGRLTEFYVHPNHGLVGWAVPVFNRRWGMVRCKKVN
jgi:hypothetical protein